MADGKNWKTGAITGLMYGTIGMGYFLFLLWLSSQPTPPGQPIIDDSSGVSMKLFIIGVLVFLPLFCMSFITAMIFSPFIPADVRISLSIACMPIYGLLLGAAMGHLFGMREKDRKNAGLEQLMVEIDETGRTR